MKLLLDERKLIQAIGNDIRYGIFGNIGNEASWKVGEKQYMVGSPTWTTVEVNDVPLYVSVGDFYYIDGTYILNEEYTSELEERVESLEEQMIESIEAQADMLGDIIMLQLGI